MIKPILSILCIVSILLPFGKMYAQTDLITNGFSKGMQTSRNIQEIFSKSSHKSNGSIFGIQTNNEISKILLPFPKTLSEVVGAKVGLITSHGFGESEDEIVSIIGKEIIFIREVYYALTTKIMDYLNKFTDREAALTNHIEYLKNLAKIEETKIMRLNQRITNLLEIQKETEKSISELENIFFQSFDKFKAKNSETSIQEFIDFSQKNVTIKAYLGALQKAKEYHDAFFPKLINRIKAIELNREALISGIRVTEVEDVDLGLIIK